MQTAARLRPLLCRPFALQIRISAAGGRASSATTMQAVDAPLTQSATFLVLSATQSKEALGKIRDAVSSTGDLIKNVSVRHPGAHLSCTVGIGAGIWDSLTSLPRPRELHPFREIHGAKHTAIATPGDVLFHIRAERRDITFEFESQLMELLGDAVTVEDSTVGFRYFDARDLLGFVDGTANPVAPDDVADAVFATAADDPAAAGGSYVVVQKYLHDMAGWRGLSTEKQEAIIGRRKADNVELPDAGDGKQLAHKTLATIEDEQGNEQEILRDNMPFGSPASKEYGTYFIGYSKQLWVVERMLERMFVGSPAGLHDLILDYSTPLTGTTFFIPPASVLERIGS